jgi:hypothetical protein
MRVAEAERSLAPLASHGAPLSFPHDREGRVATALEDVRLPAATGQLVPGALAFR